MPIRKVCCRHGCDELALDGGSHCAECNEKRLTKLKSSRARAKLGADARRGSALYSEVKWGRVKRAWLSSHPLCVDCGELGLVVVATDVDHVKPHRGCRKKFYDQSNLQSLCHSCHSRKTAREVWHRG